jgi:hypothetical protein
MLISPIAAVGVPRNPILVWYSSNSATSYHIQVSANSVFPSTIVDTTVADTLLKLSPLAANTSFYWRLSASNEHGTSEYSITTSFTTGDQIVTINELTGITREFKVFQNYPNPFNPITTIAYELPTTSFVTLTVYNVIVKKVSTLVNETRSAGRYSIQFDASNLSSGLYFYHLQAGNKSFIKKMLLLK